MKIRRKWRITVTLAAVVMLLFMMIESSNTYKDIRTAMNLFTASFKMVLANYVEDADPIEIIENAIDGMVSDLDPHTVLMKPKDYSDLKTSTQGSFGGIGIYIGLRNERLTVISPLEGTPAYRLGIQAGDQIITIEKEDTEGFTTQDAVTRLRGPQGTEVTIGIKREGVKDTLEYTIEREVIKIKSIPYYFMADEDQKIGYIRITDFSATTHSDLVNALYELENEGMEKLILDLRGNPGGLLDAAVNVVDEFVQKNKLIAFARGRVMNEQYFASSDISRDYPIVVMVNGGSASASEIVSGALQDHDKAVVLGTTTFGKGSVQRLYPTANISNDVDNGMYAMKITVAHYYIPSGRCIHRERKKGDLEKENWTINTIDTTTVGRPEYTTSKGRVVYGGGGVEPDILVKSDTNSVFIIKCLGKSLFFDFAVKYTASIDNPEAITASENIEITDEMISFIKELAKEKGIEFTDKEWNNNRTDIEVYMKAELRGKLQDQTERYKELSVRDGQLHEAIDLLKRFSNIDDFLNFADKTGNRIFTTDENIYMSVEQ